MYIYIYIYDAEKAGNTIITGSIYDNRQLDLMDRHWNTKQLIRNTRDQKNESWSTHARIYIYIYIYIYI
jgi:hypothetical protein